MKECEIYRVPAGIVSSQSGQPHMCHLHIFSNSSLTAKIAALLLGTPEPSEWARSMQLLGAMTTSPTLASCAALGAIALVQLGR